MNITPHLGIGDLLIIKMKQISNNLNINCININKDLILTYCESYEIKINFIINLIKLLFPNTIIHINNNPLDFDRFNIYKITNSYLYNHIDLAINFENKYSNYIIFHTKMRHDTLIDKFNNEMLSELNFFLENFKTSKKIIILGEKNIGENLETKVHKTISLYKNLLLLNKNNDVIDLTNDILTCGNPDFNKFLLEIEIINKAIYNITFGIGGPFNICKAFSKNNISFIPFYDLTPFKTFLDELNSIDNTIVKNIEQLNDRICKFNTDIE
jgi:hypothetical protein